MANPGSLLLKLIIDGTSAGAVKALAQVEAAAGQAGKSLGQVGSSGSLDQTKAGLAGVEAQLHSLQSLGRNALQFAGVGLGIAELIRLADTYTNMTSRLKLVTQYTGDYNQVFAGLVDSARATRSSLTETVGLYTQMAPALQGIGLNGQQAIGVVTTINQAIGLSGASSQAAAAALVQLGQGFGSGVLRGEELNSVMEQTPALAQAIADGLGVPYGELRKLGEAGELTASKVAGALQKMAPQLEADFAKMPKTVGQALTGLQNEFLVYIGATDQAAGGTSALAAVIGAVSAEFAEQGPIVTALSTAIKTLVNGFDGLYRMIKIVGLGLGAYAAAAKAALSGDFGQARAIWQQLGEDIDGVLQKPLVTMAKVDTAVADSTRKRAQLEDQLAQKQEQLEKLKLYAATGALAEIAGKEKENIDKRIAEQQRLVDAVRAAWQQSLKEAETATQAAQSLTDKAGAKRSSTADKVFNAQTKGLSSEEQAGLAAQRSQDLLDKGSYAAAAAAGARLDGRFKQAEAYQKQAEDFLQRAESFADKAGNADLIQSAGDAQARLLEAQAAAEQQKAAQLQQQAASQAEQLNKFQGQLEAMQKAAREIEVKADVAKAAEAIKGIEGQLAALKDKTVTVTVNTVQAGSGAAAGAAPAAEPTVGRAFGGPLPGSAPHDRADNMMYWGTPGEWVIQRPSVRYYGSDFLRAINERRFPKFAFGGELGFSAARRASVPALRSLATGAGGNGQGGRPLVLDFGKLGRFNASASDDAADNLVRVFKRAALGLGKR